MAKTRSMTKRPWSDLNHDVLYFVMMQLGIEDFSAFSKVCKSWRSLALLNKKRFMASRPPMSVRIYSRGRKKEWYCCLEDFKGRRLETTLPHFSGRKCVGLTCGYLILFGEETSDFWLVNPMTRHQLHFPHVPFDVNVSPFSGITAILVFSPSLSGWMLVMANKFNHQIWFATAGKGAWNHFSFTAWPIHDFHACKGNIYTLHSSNYTSGTFQLCEFRINPHPNLTLLETKDFPKSDSILLFDSSGGNLYLKHINPKDGCDFHELDFGEMKWVSRETTIKEYALYFSWNHILQTRFLKPKSWDNPCLQFDTKNRWKGRFFTANMWYFPHDCLNVNRIN